MSVFHDILQLLVAEVSRKKSLLVKSMRVVDMTVCKMFGHYQRLEIVV